MKITILTDTTSSWFIPFGVKLKTELDRAGHDTVYVHDKKNIREGDVCFILSCINLVEPEYLRRNRNNIVVHASDLPKGKGFSPMKWLVLEGSDEIVVSLIEAAEKVDSGPVYFKRRIDLDGTELCDEIRSKVGNMVIEMSMHYIENYGKIEPVAQEGEESFYKRRTVKDDEIDPSKSIIQLFNHLRIADNEHYPLYFYHKGVKYLIKIYKEEK